MLKKAALFVVNFHISLNYGLYKYFGFLQFGSQNFPLKTIKLKFGLIDTYII